VLFDVMDGSPVQALRQPSGGVVLGAHAESRPYAVVVVHVAGPAQVEVVGTFE